MRLNATMDTLFGRNQHKPVMAVVTVTSHLTNISCRVKGKQSLQAGWSVRGCQNSKEGDVMFVQRSVRDQRTKAITTVTSRPRSCSLTTGAPHTKRHSAGTCQM